MGIMIKPVSFEAILKSQTFRMEYGLMVNDSITVASMQEEGVNSLATNDEVFLRIKWLHIYKPDDVTL